uniref:Uncharacterized protein n=1 Tax=viral metagenome TaxID=1070528 RepID=A0A6M3LIH0_9ZZZZ
MEWITEVGCVYGATITVPTISSDTFAVTIQLTDYAGNDLAVAACVLCYISSTSTGLDSSDLTSEITITSGGDGSAMVSLAKYSWHLISEADGDIAIDVTDTGTDAKYLVLVMPNGKLVVSGVLTFT